MLVDEFFDIDGSEMVFGFEQKNGHFEFNALLNREPVQIIKHRSYVMEATGPCQHTSRAVLHTLHLLEKSLWIPKKQGIPIIQFRGYECMDQAFQWVSIQVWLDLIEVVQMEVGRPADVIYMVLHGWMAVKVNT